MIKQYAILTLGTNRMYSGPYDSRTEAVEHLSEINGEGYYYLASRLVGEWEKDVKVGDTFLGNKVPNSLPEGTVLREPDSEDSLLNYRILENTLYGWTVTGEEGYLEELPRNSLYVILYVPED